MSVVIDYIGILFAAVLLSTPPLLLAGLGSCYCERSGVINLGIEGMMSFGAFVGSFLAYYTHNWIIAFIGGGIAGAILGVLHAIFCISLHADQVIAGIAINSIGPGLAMYFCRLAFDGSTMSEPIDINYKIPRMFSGTLSPGSFLYNIFGSYVVSYLCIVILALVCFVFNKTRFGLQLKACGEHPKACESVGIDVYRIRYICVIFSGFMSGLAGAFITLAVVSQYRSVIIVGQGFIAIAAVILGRFNPKGTALACLFFGVCMGVKSILSNLNLISPNIISMLPYVILILVLIITPMKNSVPAANGKVYYRSK